MRPRVRRRTLANRDLVEHFAYFGEHASVEMAERFLKAAEFAFEELARMPSMGGQHTFPNPRFKGLCKWQVPGFQNYLIFYFPLEDGVDVVRVLHGARELEALFD